MNKVSSMQKAVGSRGNYAVALLTAYCPLPTANFLLNEGKSFEQISHIEKNSQS